MRRGPLIVTLSIGAFFPVPAQRPQPPQPPQLHFEPEMTLDVGNIALSRYSQVLLDRRGRIWISTGAWEGQVLAFDSTGKSLGFRTPIGGRRNRQAEIGWVNKWGLTADGDSVWIGDDYFRQLVVLDDSGKIARSMERPIWLRPAWSERRRYPLFSGLQWEAVYSDGTVLVTPGRRRALFDSPFYDRSAVYLLRASSSGKILRTIAKLPSSAASNGHRLLLRDGVERKGFEIPFFAKSAWKVSADGQRIAIAQPLLGAADSGAFRVVMLNAEGDTLFARRYVTEATRVPPEVVASRLSTVTAFGRYSAEWIRDTLRSQIPVFATRVLSVQVGIDHSVWVWFSAPEAGSRAFVIDANGDPVGVAQFPVGTRIVALSRDHIWISQRDRRKPSIDAAVLVRLKRVTRTHTNTARTNTK
jgi:hypothetical protein